MGQLRQFLQLSAVCDCADLVMREVNSREFNAVLEPLNPSDLVMRQVQSHQYVEVQQVFHSLNLVLVQIPGAMKFGKLARRKKVAQLSEWVAPTTTTLTDNEA